MQSTFSITPPQSMEIDRGETYSLAREKGVRVTTRYRATRQAVEEYLKSIRIVAHWGVMVCGGEVGNSTGSLSSDNGRGAELAISLVREGWIVDCVQTRLFEMERSSGLERVYFVTQNLDSNDPEASIVIDADALTKEWK